MAISAAGFFGLLLLWRSNDLDALPVDTLDRLLLRGPAAFMFFSGVVVLGSGCSRWSRRWRAVMRRRAWTATRRR